MGFTFKENCGDTRNTKVIDLYHELKKFNCNVDIYDPNADRKNTLKEFKVTLIKQPAKNKYDVVIILVAHRSFKKLGIKKIRSFTKSKSIIYDIKYMFPSHFVDGRI